MGGSTSWSVGPPGSTGSARRATHAVDRTTGSITATGSVGPAVPYAGFVKRDRYELPKSVGHLIHRLHRVMKATFERRLEAYDVTPAQWAVLDTVRQGTSNRPAHIASMLGQERSSVTRVVERLRGKGLLAQSADPEDRRSVVLALTPTGRALVPQLIEASRDVNALYMRGLSKPERASLHALLVKMLVHVESELETEPRGSPCSRSSED